MLFYVYLYLKNRKNKWQLNVSAHALNAWLSSDGVIVNGKYCYNALSADS